jgi:predicted hydrocarbon binding protein
LQNEFGEREIGIYYTAKGKSLAQVSMILKDIPGSLSSILAILAAHGINLKVGWFDTSDGGNTGRYSAFVDLTGCKVDSKAIKEEIMETKLVQKVEIQVGKEIVFDSHFKGLRMMDRDVLPIGTSEWSEMKRHVSPEVLTNIGRTFGEVSVDYWSDAIGKLTNRLSVWERILEARGIGDRVEIDVKKGMVTIENCFSSREFRGDGPACYTVCGMLEGILSQILMEEVHVTEIECLANYQDRCIFRIESPSTKKLKDFEEISEKLDGI